MPPKKSFTYADGEKYVGEFQDGDFNGLGIEYRANGSVARSGRWRSGDLAEAFAIDPKRFEFAAQSATSLSASRPAASSAPEREADRPSLEQLERQSAAYKLGAHRLPWCGIAALLAGLQMEAEGPASNPAPTPKKPPAAKRTAPEPRFASDGANTHHVVWLNIVSDDTNQNWFKVRSRTLDHDGSHARMQRRNLRRLGTTSTRCSQRTRKTTRTSPKPTFGWTVPAICTTPACSQFLPTAKRIRAYACSK